MTAPMRILLVEDDAEDALLFQRRCPPHFRVQHCSAAEPALSALRSGSCDVCFTDYRLGADTGLDLIRSARADGIRVPMIVITGQELESLGENALLAGATDFVPKDDLNSATIQRITRWSLIRRHVENRREDVINEEAISQLLGRTPSAVSARTGAAAGQDSGLLRRVLYLSRARRPFGAPELLLMCAGFATANARTHVTGVLIYSNQCFMQVIEGEATVIDLLLQRIHGDTRHGEMAVIVDEPCPTRLFSEWNMGSLHLHSRHALTPVQWVAVHQQVNRLVGGNDTTRAAISDLIRALPGLLDRP